MKIQHVVSHLFVENTELLILQDGEVKVVKYIPDGYSWTPEWRTSEVFSAQVTEGISGGGELGYNVVLVKDNKVISKFSVLA